jgi:hypothetical protein
MVNSLLDFPEFQDFTPIGGYFNNYSTNSTYSIRTSLLKK